MEATLVFTGDIIDAFTHDGRGIRTRTLSSGSDSRLYNHTRDIIHAVTYDGRGIRTRTGECMNYISGMVASITEGKFIIHKICK